MIGLVGAACAQEIASAVTPAQSQPTPQDASTGTLRGTVTDADGALVSGTALTLVEGTLPARSAVATAEGEFVFAGISAGHYSLTATAAGFAPVMVSGTLMAGQNLELDAIVLRTATSMTDVNVFFTRHDIALEQLHEEEHQRILAVFPNYYVSYDVNAMPLDASLKFQLAFKNTIDPVNLLLVGAQAGIEQATDTFNGYGQGAAGYGKRFGAAFADFSIGNTLGGAVLPIIFKQDPRYFVKGTGTVKSRLRWALAQVVISRGDNLKWEPAYSGILGTFASAGISNLYYPAADRSGVSLTFLNVLIGLGGEAVGNVAQEFIIKHFSTGITPPSPPASTTSASASPH